jgi:Fe2+ or Zn2+ uptake regulation protein
MNHIYEQEVVELLKNNSIAITQNRVEVFKLLKANKKAQSVSSIIRQSTTPLDRISVYRTLQCFLKKGMVLIVPNNDRDAKYILAEEKQEGKLNDKHSYFVCTGCKLTEIIMLPFNLADNNLAQYQVNKCSLILEGLCLNCK